MARLLRALVIGGIATAFVLATAWEEPPALAQGVTATFDPAVRPEFREPVTLASKDGVLEVTLTAHQGHAKLDTVAGPVQNFLVFAYQVIRGTASNGEMSGDNLYPAPTLQVFPGETLIVHLDNALTGLTIRDFFDPQYTAKGEEVPLYPEQLTSSPFNLHVHGVHVSPKGNSDNVMLHIPPGMSNTYTYHIPKNMPQGAYWYHSHLHTLTTAQTYYGLAGLLAIGRTDGNLPLVTENHIPIRNMVLQYNYVFDRKGGLAQLNNLNWPQFVSTITPPAGDELAKGTYRPLLTPVNFAQSKRESNTSPSGTRGRCRSRNHRGLFQFIPSNLQRFTANARPAGQRRAGRPVASRLSARRAVHGQRPVPAGDQEQGRTDRDLGARERQRHRLHERRSSPRRRPADIRRSPSSARTAIRPPRSTIPSPTTARGCSFRRRPATRSR